jgi:hypothetical protein
VILNERPNFEVTWSSGGLGKAADPPGTTFSCARRCGPNRRGIPRNFETSLANPVAGFEPVLPSATRFRNDDAQLRAVWSTGAGAGLKLRAARRGQTANAAPFTNRSSRIADFAGADPALVATTGQEAYDLDREPKKRKGGLWTMD